MTLSSKPVMAPALIRVRVTQALNASPSVRQLQLQACADQPLPRFSAGAHIDLHLANGLQRSYSLLNPPAQSDRYCIAVRLEPAGRGGSAYIHQRLQTGQELMISAPRNHFPLDETAEHSLLLAGGIGITPLLSMAHRLTELQRSWQLVYCGREAGQLAFLDQAQALASQAGARFQLHLDGAPGSPRLDIQALLGSLPAQAQAYCCGPAGMLEAFRAQAAHRPANSLHWEYFAPAPAPAAAAPASADSFLLQLARSGREFQVPAGVSILEVLLAQGIETEYGCMEGVCGACTTPVLGGRPDHRDWVLSAEEKAANRSIVLCCSRSLSPCLVLDL